jgi:hypothetical protein
MAGSLPGERSENLASETTLFQREDQSDHRTTFRTWGALQHISRLSKRHPISVY